MEVYLEGQGLCDRRRVSGHLYDVLRVGSSTVGRFSVRRWSTTAEVSQQVPSKAQPGVYDVRKKRDEQVQKGQGGIWKDCAVKCMTRTAGNFMECRDTLGFK